MPIDFHNQQQRMTYTTRTADESWMDCISEHVDLQHKTVADVGCGGGIYSKALIELGASHVSAVDFSAEILLGAANHCEQMPLISFQQGSANHTNLASSSYDSVLERALIHHLDDLSSCFHEANRILVPNGTLIVQDRTPADCVMPGDATHIRGYFFERFPALIEKEVARRYSSQQVVAALASAGFSSIQEVKLWETRRVYMDLHALRNDLLQRTGRSILHELTDDELLQLVDFMCNKLSDVITPIVEQDLWTIWFATKS